MPADRKITMVAPWVARAAMDSRSGTGVRPAMRVMMTLWLTPGRVYSVPTAAAAPQKEDTPGVTSQEMPSSSSWSICSWMAPYRQGSPVCRRTVVLLAASICRIIKRRQSGHYIQPPETFITCAVTYFDSSEARYSAM